MRTPMMLKIISMPELRFYNLVRRWWRGSSTSSATRPSMIRPANSSNIGQTQIFYITSELDVHDTETAELSHFILPDTGLAKNARIPDWIINEYQCLVERYNRSKQFFDVSLRFFLVRLFASFALVAQWHMSQSVGWSASKRGNSDIIKRAHTYACIEESYYIANGVGSQNKSSAP